MTKQTVAVIGGGISGLCAAFALHKRGRPYVLLEASDRFGGVIRTEAEGGFVLEAGPDSMLAQKPQGLELCRELGLGERLVPTNPETRNVFVLHRGTLHALPDGMMLAVPTRVLPMVRTRLFSWPGKLRMGLDLVLPGRAGNDDESIASFLRRRFGQEAVDRLGEPLLAGIHAGDPERLSILATFPRLRELERTRGSLVRATRRGPSSRRPGEAPPAAFYSLRCGLAELVSALVQKLEPASLRTRAAVVEVGRHDEAFELRLESGERVAAGSVVVAAPGPRIAKALAGLVPESSGVLSSVPFASTATILLGFKRVDVRHPLDGYGLVVPASERLRTNALSFVSTKLPFRAPEGHVLLRAFVGGVRDPGALSLSDDGMIETVMREMSGVLGLGGRPVMSRVFRWPSATPQLEVGHLERMRRVEREIATVRGLFLTGAGVRATGIPDMVADGTRAGEAAAESRA